MKKNFFLAAMPLLFAACAVNEDNEIAKKFNSQTTTEVVYRVELAASGSGSAMSSEKSILTESGKILSAESDEKAFFAQVGDTITVQGEKIIDIKFKK